jgi:DNA-binding MarR family transcriptional regulator|tara:strand:+ start:78 stop:275 length:198 start_codon:yes stop_codon:yes gene_type:complete
MVDKEIRKVNKKLQNMLTKERFIDRIEELIKEGMVEIVDCEEDGTPIVNITDKGRNVFLNELVDA